MSQDSDKPTSGEDKLDDPSETRNRAESLDPSEESLRKRVRQRTPSPHGGGSVPSSPPRFVSVEELMETAKGVTNMALAHEIVVNGGFQVKPSHLTEGSLEKRVREIVHKAFWDCLEAQLSEDPPTYDHAIRLLGEIKETLLSFLLPGHSRLRNQINEVLDLELIRQEAENGALDINKVAEFVISMMGTLCAPARDEEIKKLRDITAIVPLFKAIFSVMDLMKIDMANFAVSSIRPHLMQQSVEYERKKFQEFIEKQPNSLDFTQKWLQDAANALVNVEAEASPPCAGAAGLRAPALSPLTVHNQAYLRLLKWDHTRSPFPEVGHPPPVLLLLPLDLGLAFLNQCTALLCFAFVVFFPISVMHTRRFQSQRSWKNSSFNASEAFATVGEKICVEVNSCLAQHGFTPFSADRETVLKGQIEAVKNPDNSIRKLIGNSFITL
nr:PREDICTED: T-complex protein 11-like protein 1 [Lepisosteus oculatus]